MAGISFLIALLLGGAAFLFQQAAGQISIGTQWASDVCSTSQMFCHHPEYLAYAAGVMLVNLPNGKSLAIAGQKSGMVWAHDPDQKGALVWKSDVSRGQILFGA